MNYGKVFKQIRESSEMSRPEMAAELGMTTSALWKIENGKASPKKDTVCKFCRIAGISLAYFYICSLEAIDFIP